MEERSPDEKETMKVMTAKKIDSKNLTTSKQTVEKLQKSLQAKAKAEPSYRFYSLWDKVYRSDILFIAYAQCYRNKGSAGADDITFDDIETQEGGRNKWLGDLQQELQTKRYRPEPLLRVWIPKSNGSKRPLSIPSIRDRVVQMAMLLVLGPIFEEDLSPRQYAFRPGVDAKMAVRRVYFQITKHRRREIVDGDLSDYFGTIPHGMLFKSISRRVADKNLLGILKKFLQAAVVEEKGRKQSQMTKAKDNNRGIPQGGPICPLLANIYFRRFMKAWEEFEFEKKLDAYVVNYADDFVICCGTGQGAKTLAIMERLMGKLGLTINKDKTQLIDVQENSFQFLGYEFGYFYGKDGKRYLGTQPSRKAIKKVVQTIHEFTTPNRLFKSAEEQVRSLNATLRGWCNYFDQGPVTKAYQTVTRYTEKRFRRWLTRKFKQRGTHGYKTYPAKCLYEKFGLYKPLMTRESRLSAKACNFS